MKIEEYILFSFQILLVQIDIKHSMGFTVKSFE